MASASWAREAASVHSRGKIVIPGIPAGRRHLVLFFSSARAASGSWGRGQRDGEGGRGCLGLTSPDTNAARPPQVQGVHITQGLQAQVLTSPTTCRSLHLVGSCGLLLRRPKNQDHGKCLAHYLYEMEPQGRYNCSENSHSEATSCHWPVGTPPPQHTPSSGGSILRSPSSQVGVESRP